MIIVQYHRLSQKHKPLNSVPVIENNYYWAGEMT